MPGVIKASGEAAEYLPRADLKDLQGDLKRLSSKNLGKLKKNMIENGFCFPVFVWKSGKMRYIIDGHQRLKALEVLAQEGWDVPDTVPVAYIAAKTKAEAKRKLLASASAFGEITAKGVKAFVGDLDLELLRLETNIPKLDMVSDERIEGSVPFSTELLESHNFVVLYFDNDIDWLQAQTVLGIKSARSKNPRLNQVGIGRVLKGSDVIGRIG